MILEVCFDTVVLKDSRFGEVGARDCEDRRYYSPACFLLKTPFRPDSKAAGQSTRGEERAASKMFDCHAHLTDPSLRDRLDERLVEAEAAGVRGIVVVSESLDDALQVSSLP